MSASMRITKMVTALTWMLGLGVFLCWSEAITSYSGRYTADLEQKQMLLDSIREDACKTENDLQENINRAKTPKEKKTSYLKIENIALARIIPPIGKTKVAFACMNGTLSPRRGEGHISKTSDRSCR